MLLKCLANDLLYEYLRFLYGGISKMQNVCECLPKCARCLSR